MIKKFPDNFPLNLGLKMHHDAVGQFWFYHKGSSPQDYPLLYQELINQAKFQIETWDPYFNVGQNDQDIFRGIKNDVTIKILTIKGLDKGIGSQYIKDVLTSMKTALLGKKNVRFGFRVINKGELKHQDWLFHDRFLIIDKQQVYLIGSSIGYHIKPEQSTGILKIVNTETADFIISLFNAYWQNCPEFEIPVKFINL